MNLDFFFLPFNTHPSTKNVKTTNGSSSTMMGVGFIPLTSSMSPSTVFHIPCLSSNLLSIIQIT